RCAGGGRALARTPLRDELLPGEFAGRGQPGAPDAGGFGVLTAEGPEGLKVALELLGAFELV
ncbi:hypothetical protein OFN28_29730, partial [Escherichia coli]|nr:hypothetical protein [Escherichia coli]